MDRVPVFKEGPERPHGEDRDLGAGTRRGTVTLLSGAILPKDSFRSAILTKRRKGGRDSTSEYAFSSDLTRALASIRVSTSPSICRRNDVCFIRRRSTSVINHSRLIFSQSMRARMSVLSMRGSPTCPFKVDSSFFSSATLAISSRSWFRILITRREIARASSALFARACQLLDQMLAPSRRKESQVRSEMKLEYPNHC